ncbi:MAG: hypothetical protein LBH26_06580 [Treponema sp.]|jgi:hypothetical protein|nr:hypothetical protein [Treponema sp.]
MRKTVILFVLCAVFARAGRLSALPAQKILYPGDWAYQALETLSMEQRLVFLSGSSLTVIQAERMLADIDDRDLSPAGQALYERLRAYLAKPALVSRFSGLFNFDIAPALQPELYYKTSEDLPWIYGRNQRQPFAAFPLGFSISSYVAMESDLYFGENRRLSEARDNYFNFPFDKMIDGVQPIDTNMPKRAYLSIGFPFGQGFGLNFKIGLGDEILGRTSTGSVIFSDNMRGFSYGTLSFYAPFISYTASAMELEVTKYLYLHHLQLRILKRLSFGLAEGVMVNASFERRYLNPMMIFHSFSAWESYDDYNADLANHPEQYTKGESRIGSYLGITADFRPWKYGRFYGLAAMNQFQIPSEREDEDATVPDGLAFQLGYESWIPLSLRLFNRDCQGHLWFGLEGVYTYPYMYILADKGWSYYRESTEVSNGAIREWVGSPFGPDSAAGTIWAGYQDSSLWSLSLSFLYLAQGPNSDPAIFARPNREYYSRTRDQMLSRSPTGTASHTYQLSLKAEWSPLDWLSLSFRPGYRIVSNYARQEGRLEQGLELVLSARLVPKLSLGAAARGQGPEGRALE